MEIAYDETPDPQPPADAFAAVVRADGRRQGYLVQRPRDENTTQVVDVDAIAPGGRFQVLPEMRPDVASHTHITGISGAGKSTWMNRYAEIFRELHGGEVHVVSSDPEDDPNLTEVDSRTGVPEFIAAEADEEGGATTPKKAEDLRPDREAPPMLLIVDDIGGLDDKTAKTLRMLMGGIHERGRRLGIHTLNAFHRGANNKQTQSAVSQATGYVVFPRVIDANTSYMLHDYADVPQAVSSMLRRSAEKWGRSVYVKKGQYLAGEKRASIFDAAKFKASARAEVKALDRVAEDALAARMDRVALRRE